MSAALPNEVKNSPPMFASDVDSKVYPRARLKDTNGRLKVDAHPVADGRNTNVGGSNAVSLATVAAPAAGYQLGVSHLSASYSDLTKAGTLTLVQDTAGTPSTLGTWNFTGSVSLNFNPPIPAAAAKSLSGSLTAATAATGAVNIVTVTQKV